MGLYLSPWDRNRADYGKPEYIEYYRNQLRELLTGYGDVSRSVVRRGQWRGRLVRRRQQKRARSTAIPTTIGRGRGRSSGNCSPVR
ncbi:MAG: hypothetical protein ACLR8Y_00980 [Alistipes indistinctus]